MQQDYEILKAQFGRLEALMERNSARQEAYEINIASGMKEAIIELRIEIMSLEAKIDRLIDALSIARK